MSILQMTALLMLALAVICAAVRVAWGPDITDRIVALDLLGALSIGILGVLAVVTGETLLLHVSVAVALLLFVGTVAFAFYIERGVRR